MVLGKLPVPGRPTILDYSRARAYCTCSRCGWGIVWTFFLSSIISHFLLPVFGKGPIARAVGADGVVWTFFFSRISFLFAFSLSLGDGPI